MTIPLFLCIPLAWRDTKDIKKPFIILTSKGIQKEDTFFDDIKRYLRPINPDVSIEKIIKVTIDKYGEDTLKSKRRNNIGRNVGIYLCRNLTRVKNIEIGRVFGIKVLL